MIGTLIPAAAGENTMTQSYALPAGGAHQAVRAVFRHLGGEGACVAGGYTDRDDVVFRVD